MKQMEFSSIAFDVCYVFSLKSFIESRTTRWVHFPHCSGVIDDEKNGCIPSPWDIPVVYKKEWQKERLEVFVPHSERVKDCHSCRGRGRGRCITCWGNGTVFCCHDKTCWRCKGTGRLVCRPCNGSGSNKCRTCAGHGKVKFLIQMTVKWDILTNRCISRTSGLKETRIVGSKKRLMFEETDERLNPLTPAEFPDQEIVNASIDLMEKHMQRSVSQRVLKQTQGITALPLTVVQFQRKGKQGKLWVFGDDKDVCFQSYPAHCCVS